MLLGDVPLQLLKVDGYTLSRSNSFFIFASLFYGDPLLKERICSTRSRFVPLRADPNLRVFIVHGSEQPLQEVIVSHKKSRNKWRCTRTTPAFSAMFTKGDHFCDFLFAHLEDKVFPKWDLLFEERICS